MSTGFVLNIPDTMLEKLKETDKHISSLATKSKNTEAQVVSAFRHMADNGVGYFLQQMRKANELIDKVGTKGKNMNVGAGMFSDVAVQAKNAIDEVNRVVTAIGKIRTVTGNIGEGVSPKSSGLEVFKNGLDSLFQKIEKLKGEMDTFRQWESGNLLGTADYAHIGRVADEINRLMRAYEELYRAQQTVQQKDPFKAKVDDLSRESLEAQRYKNSMQAMKEFYAEQDKEMKKAAKEAEADRKRREKEEKATADRIAAYDSKARRERYKAYTTTYEGAMRTSDRAKTLLQEQQAIKNLEAARAKLNKTDSDYANKLRNLNQRILEHKNNIDKATAGSKNLQKEHRSLMDISGQLARRLALVFSVSQITGYVKKLIEVRGEFELQQRSLQAILQNKDEANRIWQQTVDLAVRSPFRVKELVSYTKQLAAYRIESDKLFETNKMLADISAGLGVDMQRLILAFGQVRSAAYLRGTELRQFTEAGIPILEQLAQYFTDLEGRAVSVGDVFERVSKRMVSFADVEEIFRRMTSEGGTFYRMQEIQAETLQGQISNLKDSVDIMLNEIGKAYEGTLKNSISFVRSLIENWESLANTLKAVVAAFAMTKLNALLAKESVMLLAIDMGILTNASQKQLKVTQLLSVGWNSFTKSIKNAAKGMKDFVVANPKVAAVLLLVSAFWKVGKAAWDFRNTLKEIDKQYASIADKQASAFVGFRNALNDGDLQKQKAALSNLINLANNEYNMEVKIDITGLSEEELNEEFNKLRQKLIEANAFASEFAKEQERSNQRDKWWSMSAFLGWDDDMFEDIDDMGDAYTKLNNRMVNMLPSTINMLQERFDSLSESQKELLKSLNTPIKKDESLVDYFNRLKIAFESLSEEGFVDDNKFNRFFRQFERSSRRAKEEFNAFIESFNDEAMSIADKDERTFFLDIAIDKYSSEKNWSEFEENQIRKWIEDAYNIKFNMVMADGSQTLEPWADRVYGAISKINDEIKKKSEGVSDADLFPLPKVGQTKEAYLALAKEVIGIAEMTYNETQQIEDESMVNRTKALAPYADEVRKILNLYKEIMEGGGDKDTFTPMLRTVKEIYQEFKKLQGSFDDLTAKEGALAKFGDAFKEAFGKTPEQMGFDLFSEEGVKAAYDYLISKAPDAKKKIQVQLAKGEIVWDVKLQTKKDADKELLDGIQELFDQYDLSLELKKLNIPPDLAKSLFDVDYLDLEGLKKAVEDQEAKFIGTDMEDEYKKFLDKIDDLEEKQQKESAKRFVKFLTKNLDQTRVVLEQKGIDISYAKLQFDTGAISAQSFAEVVREITKRANEDISKINFEKFKDSSLYVKAMGDLAAYSKKELDKMTEALSKVLAENAKNMSVEELEAYHKALERIRKEQEKFDPFIRDNEIAKIQELIKLEKELANEEKNRKELAGDKVSLEQKRMSLLRLLEEAQSKGNTGEAQSTKNLQDQLLKTEGEIQQIDSLLANSEMNISNISGQIGNITGGAMGAIAMIDMIVQAVNDTCNAAKKTFEDIMELADSFGVETDKGSWREASMFFEGMSNFNAEVTEGWENLKSGNLMGAIANTIGSIVGFIRDVNKWKDSNAEEFIQSQLEEVERLEKEYEKLEWVIDRAFSFDKYGKVAEQTKNLGRQIDNLQSAIAAEEDKKDTDPERIKELKEDIEETSRQIQELYDNLRADIVGTFEDLSTTLGEAMISALQQGEDAIAAWGEEVDNIIQDIVGKLLIQKFLEPKIADLVDSYYAQIMPKSAIAEKKYQEYLDAMDSGDSNKADQLLEEYLKLNEQAINEVPKISEDATKQFHEGLNATGDWFLNIIPDWFKEMISSSQGGGLSALQKGIQGVTEETAQVLEALLNSMRFYVADSNAKLTQLLNNMMEGETESPMLAELRAQTKWMRDIYNLINGMTATHPSGGRGIKTVM